MPPYNCIWMQGVQSGAPTIHVAREEYPEHPVSRCSSWSLHRLPEHGHLLLESQVLKDQLTPRLE